MSKQLFKLGLWCLGILIVLSLGIWLCNFFVERSTKTQVFNNYERIPFNEVGLVLGTSKYTVYGNQNPYFANRMHAAVELFKRKKVKHLLVSGDNSLKEYNEPKHMRKALMKAGIPDSCITMDFAGFRTLDSIVRSKRVFGQDKVTIISQKFHNHRALFIANQKGVTAIAFNAKDVPFNMSLKTRLREWLARCKAVLDVLLNTQPKFLGEPIPIAID